MSYIYVEKDGVQAQYLITSTANEPRICVNTTGYVPLVMGTINAPMIKYAPADGYETLRAGSYTTTTVKSTSSSVGSSSVGCAGTSSSSGSTVNTTIQASTAMSFTSTSAFTRSSTSGYNGLSGAAAQTCSSTSSWAGSSTRQSNYQSSTTNSNGPYSGSGLSSTTVLSRTSTSGYTGSSSSGSTYDMVVANSNVGAFTKTRDLTQLSTTGYDHQSEYRATTTWYNSPTRTYGYSGYSIQNVAYTMSYRIETGYSEGWAGGETHVNIKATDYGVSYMGYFSDTRNAAYCHYTFTAGVGYQSYNSRYGNQYMAWVLYHGGYRINWNGQASYCSGGPGYGEAGYEGIGTYYVDEARYYSAVDSAGMNATTALTETYIDYGNPQYNYDWVETAVVPLVCTTTTAYAGRSSSSAPYYATVDENHGNVAGFTSTRALTRSSTSGYTGISSRQSWYQTTLANSAGLSSVTALTRSSTSAYTGVTWRSSGYYSSQVNTAGMTNATALTSSGVSAYAGSSSRSSAYNTWNYNGAGLSYTTALTSAQYQVTDSWTYINGGSGSQIVTVGKQTVYTTFVVCTGNDGHGHSSVYTGSNSFVSCQTGVSTWSYTYQDTHNAYGYVTYTTGYSGVSSQRSDYYVEQPSAAGIWNTTALYGTVTTAYSGSLSRVSTYNTTIGNNAGALVTAALTCSSTSQWGGKSSTSESISSTENRTSYFTSGYTESTTASATNMVMTTTIYSNTMTVQSSSLSSGNGYKIVGGALVVDQGGYAYYTVESYSTHEQSTFVVVAESMETTTLRTSTYTRTSQAIMSYGARTSLSTYINTNTYIETIWDYM